MLRIGDARLVDVDEPELAPGELLIQPIVTGVCSTDVHVLNQGAAGATCPVTLGHELVGRVVESRPDGRAPAPYPGEPSIVTGSIVTVEPLLPCETCDLCVRGFPNICTRSRHLGITRDGCFADYVSAPASRAFPVGGLAPDRAIFIEPLACALHFLQQGGVQPGMWVLVAGAGPAGLMAVQAAVAAGARVIVSEPDDARRSLAASLGASATIDPRAGDFQAALRDGAGGAAPDVAIEITGVPGVVSQVLSSAAPGSTVVLAGICGVMGPAIDSDSLVTREVTVRGAVASRWQFQRAAALLRDERINTAALVTHRRPWHEAAEMIDLAAGVDSVVKVLLDH